MIHRLQHKLYATIDEKLPLILFFKNTSIHIFYSHFLQSVNLFYTAKVIPLQHSVLEGHEDILISSSCCASVISVPHQQVEHFSAKPQLHCHVQPWVWALLLCLLGSCKSRYQPEKEASAFHKRCPGLLHWNKTHRTGRTKFRVKWADLNCLIKWWVKESMAFHSLTLVSRFDVITFVY